MLEAEYWIKKFLKETEKDESFAGWALSYAEYHKRGTADFREARETASAKHEALFIADYMGTNTLDGFGIYDAHEKMKNFEKYKAYFDGLMERGLAQFGEKEVWLIKNMGKLFNVNRGLVYMNGSRADVEKLRYETRMAVGEKLSSEFDYVLNMIDRMIEYCTKILNVRFMELNPKTWYLWTECVNYDTDEFSKISEITRMDEEDVKELMDTYIRRSSKSQEKLIEEVREVLKNAGKATKRV